ncbi:DinB family protein [Hydrogenimonas sp.]
MDESRIDSSKLKGLAPAGAGLSPLRAMMARHILLPLLARSLSFDFALGRFVKEGERIAALAEGVEEKLLFKRVLVPPLFGLEENSRYYSVAMVLQHLLDVGSALQARIPKLSRGEKPPKAVRIEDYKPYTDIDADIILRYRRFVAGFRPALLQTLGDTDAPHTHAHPWFGELNPKGWMVMGMVHQIVHRRQIEGILGII